MKIGTITINGSTVNIQPGANGEVWLTRWQIAQLFNVSTVAITNKVKAIIKSQAIHPYMDGSLELSGETLLPEHYDMEMIIALAFRIDTATANTFRKWIVRKAISRQPSIYISCNASGESN